MFGRKKLICAGLVTAAMLINMQPCQGKSFLRSISRQVQNTFINPVKNQVNKFFGKKNEVKNQTTASDSTIAAVLVRSEADYQALYWCRQEQLVAILKTANKQQLIGELEHHFRGMHNDQEISLMMLAQMIHQERVTLGSLIKTVGDLINGPKMQQDERQQVIVLLDKLVAGEKILHTLCSAVDQCLVSA